jgi:DNA modification methylase
MLAPQKETQNPLYRKQTSHGPEISYSGDQPNPDLRSFTEVHQRERPYDRENDTYKVAAFTKPIETTKATAIYNMHTYWSKKPHDAIRQYIRHYTQQGDLVLDPFCGSGGTALAALMEGRKAIAIDRSPAATFITKNYCTPVDLGELQQGFEELKRTVRPEIGWLYETRCDRCEGIARTDYTLYSQVFQCPRCMERVALFDCSEVVAQRANGKQKRVRVCPMCEKQGHVEEISTRERGLGQIPVLVSYTCNSGCEVGVRRHNDENSLKREYFNEYDLGKLREIDAKEIPHWYPTQMMIKGYETCVKRNLEAQGVRTVSDLFTKRNLWALAAYFDAADKTSSDLADVIKFGLNSILLAMSRMQGYVEDPRFPNQLMRGTYYLPQVSREYPVHVWLDGKLKNLIAGYRKIEAEATDQPVVISTQSALDMSRLMSASVDFIFTDPPYSGTQQYGELNFVWESWLKLDTRWQDEEIIVNEVRGRTESDWAEMMRQAMVECYRILKPGRWLSLCYHDTSEGTWALIQDIMAEVGFLVDKSESALFISAKQKSFNQLTADKVNKRDLVINFRKPKFGETVSSFTITGQEDETTFNEKVRAIIRDFLTATPGGTKDRIYDEVVSRMVRAGLMEAHDFNALLGYVAEEAGEQLTTSSLDSRGQSASAARDVGRWYLKETEMSVVDSAESAKEDSAAASIKSFINEYFASHRGEDGVHYSDIFEHFVYTVTNKPRRPLAEWLLDYFFKTDKGTYRLPVSEEEEELKREGRLSGTNRRIKRYIAHLEQGTSVPTKERPNDATLAEWIRSAKRSGMYDAGKILYEKGGLNLNGLSEELVVKVEEDYQVCTRLLARGGTESTAKKRRNTK